MSKKARFKCLHCREIGESDSRNRGRQKYCSKEGCRKASKAASQQRWTEKEENRNYFRGSAAVDRVRRWRREHPGYWRKKGAVGADALQETCGEQVLELQMDREQESIPALQDIIQAQPAVLVGLISVLTGHALQEDIAVSARSFQSRGEDILRMGRWEAPLAENENQTCSVCASVAARAAAV